MTQLFKIFIFINLISLFGNSDKLEATEFAKQIVKTYFDKNCKANLNLWNDSIRIFILDSDTIISSKQLFNDTTSFCERFVSKKRFDKSYTYENYLNDYDIRIYSKKEFTDTEVMKKNDEDETLAGTFFLLKDKFKDNDFLFIGNHRKDGSTNSIDKKISHWRSWILVLSKTQKGWKIIAALP